MDKKFAIKNNKCFVEITDEAIFDVTTSLTTIFNTVENGVTVYQVSNNTDTNIYPVLATGDEDGNAGTVLVIKNNSSGIFIFEYNNQMWFAHAFYSLGVPIVNSWIAVIQDIPKVEIPIGGFGFSTASGTASDYATEIGYGTWEYTGKITSEINSGSYVFINSFKRLT